MRKSPVRLLDTITRYDHGPAMTSKYFFYFIWLRLNVYFLPYFNDLEHSDPSKVTSIPTLNISIPDGLLHWLCRARAHHGGRGGLEVLGPRPGRPVPGRGGQVGVCWQSHLDQDNEVSEGVIGLNSATKWTSPLIWTSPSLSLQWTFWPSWLPLSDYYFSSSISLMASRLKEMD